MTCIIAIETATEACSAALLLQEDGKQTIFKRFQLAPREHTKLILPMLDEVLAEAKLKLTDVDAIAFGRGPGAFTGLRIATGIAQGLALSIDKPTIAVSSLTAMALSAQQQMSENNIEEPTSIVVSIDARMSEVYWAEYTIIEGKLTLVGEEQLSKPSVIYDKTQSLMQTSPVVLIGSGWDVYLEAFQDKNPDMLSLYYIENKFPEAEHVSQLALLAFEKGELQSIEEAQPVYLRNNVAEKSKKQNPNSIKQ